MLPFCAKKQAIVGTILWHKFTGALSAESALLWPQILLRLGDTVGAVLAAEEGTRIHPSSEALWLQHLQLSVQLVLAAVSYQPILSLPT